MPEIKFPILSRKLVVKNENKRVLIRIGVLHMVKLSLKLCGEYSHGSRERTKTKTQTAGITLSTILVAYSWISVTAQAKVYSSAP